MSHKKTIQTINKHFKDNWTIGEINYSTEDAVSLKKKSIILRYIPLGSEIKHLGPSGKASSGILRIYMYHENLTELNGLYDDLESFIGDKTISNKYDIKVKTDRGVVISGGQRDDNASLYFMVADYNLCAK